MVALRIIGFLVGLILLLPGLCSIVFIFLSAQDAALGRGGFGSDGMITLLWIICLAISVGGIFLIRLAVRGRRAPPTAPSEPPTAEG